MLNKQERTDVKTAAQPVNMLELYNIPALSICLCARYRLYHQFHDHLNDKTMQIIDFWAFTLIINT